MLKTIKFGLIHIKDFGKRCIPSLISKRMESNYDPYPEYETPSPYRERKGVRRFYEYRMHKKGLLPRPEGKFENIELPLPEWDPRDKDKWTSKRALFGQNDYIDILGDGTLHPWELIKAPPWLKGYKGNEMQRLVRQLGMYGTFIKDTFPTQYTNMNKQVFYLFKKLNRRKRSPHWGGTHRYSRIDRPKI